MHDEVASVLADPPDIEETDPKGIHARPDRRFEDEDLAFQVRPYGQEVLDASRPAQSLLRCMAEVRAPTRLDVRAEGRRARRFGHSAVAAEEDEDGQLWIPPGSRAPETKQLRRGPNDEGVGAPRGSLLEATQERGQPAGQVVLHERP